MIPKASYFHEIGCINRVSDALGSWHFADPERTAPPRSGQFLQKGLVWKSVLHMQIIPSRVHIPTGHLLYQALTLRATVPLSSPLEDEMLDNEG